MVFQDFDLLSERRRLERQQKLRKKIAIAAVSGIAFFVIVGAGVFALVSNHKSSPGNNGGSAVPQPVESAKPISRVTRVIKTVCNATTYQETCQKTLEREVEKDPSLAQPKNLLKIAIKAADEEIKKVLKKASSFKFDDPREKAAFEDCLELVENAKEELKDSVAHVGDDLGKLAKNAPDLNNWLSAVMSYQQTCIDGFPDGKLKSDMEKTFKVSKELTSNSLAMVSSLTSFMKSFPFPAALNRRLLAKEDNSPALNKDDLPGWMSNEDRRILKGASTDKPKPNVTVAKDGSGDFKTISEALAAMPAKYEGRYVIFVKQGIYDETVTVTKKMANITIYGDGSQKTIVTGNKNFADGVQTFRTATFAVLGDGFLCKAMGFRNTAGPEKHQAVAIRVQADRAIFLNCRFEGYQDTLYAQTHRQFYRSCVITGTVDFIFGDATAIFQNCLITVRKPLENQQNLITAQGRVDEHETTGIVLQNCRIEPDKDLVPVKTKIRSYLGRPWKEFSRTIIMESTIGDFIHPDGWLPWQGEFGLKTLYYAEYNNKGAGAKTTARIKWPGYHIINNEEAMKFTAEPFYQGDWISATGSPIHLGLFSLSGQN
ncbi:pectinesterase/pectinesterase inhibitor 45 [Populus alba x Populus x berolinensis]|uniref:Pectinesterase n=1 Tax=Populus alba x Populus x berolinensis TaxID=444605 RepID=A0AAD6PQL2_9ROSI|nr:pectinesterase/pectinesterase inhibitor 45 [Populus alba x Populus x berolinensis]